MCLLSIWWLVVLAISGLRVELPWAVPPTLAHGLLFTLGFMPAFMAGFLFTAGPRWLARPPIDARSLLAPMVQFAAGSLLILAGVHLDTLLAAIGLAMAAAGWMRLTLRFVALLRASSATDRFHARWLAVACMVGVASMLLGCRALLLGEVESLRAAIQLGLWAFVVPVFVLASHRMVPVLEAAALPRLRACGAHAQLLPLLTCLFLTGLAQEAWLSPWLLAPILATVALALLVLALRWRLSHRPAGEAGRLLAMLQTGFVWLGVAIALQALSLTLKATGREGLGSAPLHALTLGYLGSTLMAMATRVVAGHSGRPLAVDRIGWRLNLLLQLGVFLRLVAALSSSGGGMLVPAAAVWASVATAWTWRYVGWLGQPRADGRPG